jgi:Flp pilus assembly protein TadD
VAYHGRGIAYGFLDQNERAIQDLDEAIRLDPQDADAYYNRGVAYQHLGMTEESERDFEKAKELGFDSETDE